MDQPEDFRYFLTYNSVRRPIVFTPESWEKNSSISYKRDLKYFGMLRDWALPLSFVEDGAAILRNAYYAEGVEAGVILEVEVLDRSTRQYEIGFKSDVDFSEVEDTFNTFTVMLMAGGLTAKLKAYDNVKFEYPLTGADIVNLVLPGVAFVESSTAIIYPLIPGNGHVRYIPQINVATATFQSAFVENQSTNYQDVNDGSFSASNNWFIKSNRIQTVRIKGNLKGGSFGTSGRSGFSVRMMNQANQNMRTLYVDNREDGLLSFDFNFDFEYTLAIGERLYLYVRMNSTGGVGVNIEDGTLELSYNSVSDPSNCKGIKGTDLFKRIINKIAPGTPAESYLLANAWKDLVFTSGNGIRELPDAKIKISLSDFYQTMNSIDDAGMGPDAGVLRLENRSYFMRMAQSVDVGVIADDACTIVPAKFLMANLIKVGYEDKNTDEKDGLNEVNSGQQWTTPTTKVKDEYNWVSVVRADQYGIEKIRVGYNVLKTDTGKSTADTSSDNDTFMVDAYQDGENYRPVLGSSYEIVTGVNSPATVYNLRLSPKNNLLRHGAFLRSVLDKVDARYINFASAQKNAELFAVKNSIGVKENENILVGSLPDKYFIPHIAKINCKLPYRSIRLFENVPFGYMVFNWKGATLKGFILEGSEDIAKNTNQDFELLLTPDTNLFNIAK